MHLHLVNETVDDEFLSFFKDFIGIKKHTFKNSDTLSKQKQYKAFFVLKFILRNKALRHPKFKYGHEMCSTSMANYMNKLFGTKITSLTIRRWLSQLCDLGLFQMVNSSYFVGARSRKFKISSQELYTYMLEYNGIYLDIDRNIHCLKGHYRKKALKKCSKTAPSRKAITRLAFQYLGCPDSFFKDCKKHFGPLLNLPYYKYYLKHRRGEFTLFKALCDAYNYANKKKGFPKLTYYKKYKIMDELEIGPPKRKDKMYQDADLREAEKMFTAKPRLSKLDFRALRFFDRFCYEI